MHTNKDDLAGPERFSEFSAWDDLGFMLAGTLVLLGPIVLLGLFIFWLLF